MVECCCVQDETKHILDSGYDVNGDGLLFRKRTAHPIAWEQHRPCQDGMVVETNLGLSLISQCHTNSSVISCEDAGDSVQEYQRSYMTKECGGLRNTASVLLTTMDEIRKYPSSAEDWDTATRQAKYLASRTVNAFAGTHQWPLSLMVYALQGRRSFVSSDAFWYIFPWSLVRYLEHCDSSEADEQGLIVVWFLANKAVIINSSLISN